MTMRYLLGRIAGFAAVLAVLSVIVFSLTHMVPGDPVKMLVGTRAVTPGVRAAITAKYHLDEPLWSQYLTWLGRALHGDFGDSVRNSAPVTDILAGRVALTGQLTALAFAIAVAVGVPLGVVAARRAGTGTDRLIVGASVVGVSAPGFALGMVLLYVFALMGGLFPIYGEGGGFADRLWHLALPAVALAVGTCAMIVRVTRAAVITELASDYVLFARSRGLSERRTTLMYLKGAALPIVTSAGLILGSLFGSTVLVEEAFSLPGIGQLLADSITYKDIPGVVAVWAALPGFLAPGALDQDLGAAALPAGSPGHLLGTDKLGRDILALTIAGARSAVVGPVVVAAGSMLVGMAAGISAAWFGSWWDALVSRGVEVLLSLPVTLLAIVVAGVVGGSYWVSVAVLTVLFAPSDVRMIRAAALAQMGAPYIESARVLRLPTPRILALHIAPNVAPIAWANLFVNTAFALVSLSGLSYLGFGVSAQAADWGRQLADARTFLSLNPAAALAPGTAIIVVAAAFNIAGDWWTSSSAKGGQ